MMFPRDVSAEGWRIDQLLHTANLVLAGVAVCGIVFLVTAVLRFRARGNQSRAIRPPLVHPGLIPLFAAGLMFLGFDGFLFYRSLRDLGPLVAPATGAVRIEVNAHQWAWEFRYPGPDQRFASDDDIVTTGELHVPIGRPVELQLGSSDVVHSFHLPNLRVKREVVPGHLSAAQFTPTLVGSFEIACAQFCGVFHYRMRGLLRVMSPAEFDAWLASAEADGQRMRDELERVRSDPQSAAELPTGSAGLPGRDWGWEWH
jgi:cytochrome c oxidase subunit 2